MTNSPSTTSAVFLDDGVIDRAELFERFEGDTDLLREVIGLFLRDCPIRLGDMCAAIEREDSQALMRAAHSVKGSAGNFAAASVVEAALRLELMGRQGDLREAKKAYEALEAELARLIPALEQVA